MSASPEKDESPTIENKIDAMFEKWLNGLPTVNIKINPSVCLVSLGAWFGYSAYRDYSVPLQSILNQQPESSNPQINLPKSEKPLAEATAVQQANKSISTTGSSNTAASTAVEEISQREATIIARRAFRIATKGTIATFSLVGAAVFLVLGLDSMEKSYQKIRQWARPKQLLESAPLDLGIKTIDRSHPDFRATRGMSEAEEWRYIVQKYFSFSWESGDEHNNQNETSTDNNVEDHDVGDNSGVS